MAVLKLENGTIFTDLSTIAETLAPLKVSLNRWPVGEEGELNRLLGQDSLTDAEKEQVLQGLDQYFEELKKTAGYQSRDLIVLHPETQNLEGLLSKFYQCHIHEDDEVRYIVAGVGVFGFVLPDQSQIELTVEAQEYINVPANTEHWFHLTAEQRVKAVRYFTSMEGWVPVYTGREIRV